MRGAGSGVSESFRVRECPSPEADVKGVWDHLGEHQCGSNALL